MRESIGMTEFVSHKVLRTDDRAVLDIGARIWKWTYGAGMGDQDVSDAILDRMSRSVRPEGVPAFNELPDEEESWWRALCFAAKWADAGFPKIVCGSHKYAAALMCTNASLEADIVLPWKAFSVSVPNGLLAKGDTTFTHVRVWSFGSNWHMEVVDERGQTMWLTRLNASDLLMSDRWCDSETSGDWSSESDRISSLARRLVVGCLATIQHTNNFKDRGLALREWTAGRTGPPKHRIVVVGAPIRVDVRSAVAAYIAGRRGGVPSVQTLVRGHYKRQVIGVGRSGRKVIWVEPYWRGPEDAPILARPYKVGTA